VPTSITVTAAPHWFNGWFLRLFAVPVIQLDDTEHTARWHAPATFDVAPGPHVISAGARYRGFHGALGTEPTRLDVRPEDRLHLTARNGLLNHQPFRIRPTR
jgi:hypothetical protein